MSVSFVSLVISDESKLKRKALGEVCEGGDDGGDGGGGGEFVYSNRFVNPARPGDGDGVGVGDRDRGGLTVVCFIGFKNNACVKLKAFITQCSMQVRHVIKYTSPDVSPCVKMMLCLDCCFTPG